MKITEQRSGVFGRRQIRLDVLECPDYLYGLAERFYDAALWRFGDAIEPPPVAVSLMAMSNRLRDLADAAHNRVEDGTSEWRKIPPVGAVALSHALRQAYAA